MAQKEVGKSVSAGRKTPVLSLRDVVVYPHMVIPLFVGRDHSERALEECMNIDKQIILVRQKDTEIEEADPDNLFGYGTMDTVQQMLRLRDGSTNRLGEGGQRVRLNEAGR